MIALRDYRTCLAPGKLADHCVRRKIPVGCKPYSYRLGYMDTPSFDQFIGQYLKQSGMLSGLSGEDTVRLEAALGAIAERHAAFPQPAYGDASREQCRQWLDRLLQIFEDFSFSRRPIASTPAHFALVTSWWAHANRQAKAIHCLVDNGLGADAVPLARSVIEFALWSVALSQDEGPLLNTVMRNSDQEQLYTLKLAIGGPLEMPPEVIELTQSVPKVDGPGSEDKNFSQICRSLGVGNTILITWRTLSTLCHPVAATAYLSTQLGPGEVRVQKTLTFPGMGESDLADEMVSVVTLCLIWSGLAVDRVLDDHPLYAELHAIATEAHVEDLPAVAPPASQELQRSPIT